MNLRGFSWMAYLAVSCLGLASLAHSASLFAKEMAPKYEIIQGSSVELTCLTANKNVECSWLKNGNTKNPKPGRYEFATESSTGDCSMKIINATFPQDDGIWQCQIPSAEHVPPTWPQTQVVVVVKPTSLRIKDENLAYAQITADKPSNIICESQGGNPLPSLEWQIGGQNITQNATITVNGTSVISTLRYVFKKTDNASSLFCKSVHPLGEQTPKVLNVLYRPIVTVQQKMYTVLDGQSLEVECSVDSNPPSQAIWKPSQSVIGSDKFTVTGGKLTLPKVTHEMDNTDFQCSATNTVGNSEPTTIKLNVLYQPRLLNASPITHRVKLGDDLRLKCKFAGNPNPRILWNFVDSIFSQEHSPVASPEDPGFLDIKNASYSNEGDYYCEGINDINGKQNQVRTHKMAVNVHGRPQFLKNKESVVGYQNTNSIIEQIFCSDPAPSSVEWVYDGSTQHTLDPIEKKDDRAYIDMEESNSHITAGPLMPLDPKSPNPTCFKAALLIRNTDIADTKDFTIIVKNQDGVAEGLVNLQVYSKMSGAMMIAVSLIVLVMCFILTIVCVMILRRRTTKRNPGCEDKSDVQVPINDSVDTAKKTSEK